MPKKTIYVSEKDEPVWDEAKRLLRFHEDIGLSAFLTPVLQRYLDRHKDKMD